MDLSLSTLVTPAFQVVVAVTTALIARYVPQGIAAFEARTGIMLTDQQTAAAQALISTSAGVLETKLDQGLLSVAHININNPAVLAEAQSIMLDAAPVASALGLTVDGVAKSIVAAVDTGSRIPAPVAALSLSTGVKT